MPKNADVKLGWPYPKRKKTLEDLAKQPQGKYSHLLKFQNQPKTFSVFTVEIDLPKYRLANGRTQAAQEMYLAKHPDLGSEFFIIDPESEQVQSVQHDLLWKMVESTNLLNYFEDTSNNQELPLVLTHDGFVVNGNRRLCAMRELYYDDREKYSKYGYVDVVILPVCSDKAVDELEAYLQIQPEIKADYTWIAKACMLRVRQVRYGYTNEALASLYGISEKEIVAMLAHLALVDDYLGSRNRPKQYESVEKDEFAFKQLYKARQQLKRPDEKDLLTELAFCLVESGDTVQGRLYQRIPEIKDYLPLIAERLDSELKPDPVTPKPNTTYELFGTAEAGYESLVSVVSKPQHRATVIDSIIEVIDDQKAKDKDRVKANAVLRQAIDANTHLRNAINYINEDTVKFGIEEQLIEIEKSISEIRSWLRQDA
jgi:hypothetical protein